VIDTREQEQLLTLQEVKLILQIGYERILELIRNGELEGYALEGGTKAIRVTPASLDAYLESRKIRQ
jgi:excisionase family DNA binding protein